MHFPNEVWLQIFSFLQFRLEPGGGTAVAVCPPWPVACLTLAKISRVSKRFHAMAVPLYHTVPVSSYPLVRFRLARTLIECPHLAELVQEAHIKVEHVRDSDLSDALEAALEKCPEHMAPFFQHLLGRYRRQECSDADRVAFFLRMLPNLRVAELEVDLSSQTMLEMLSAWGSSLLPQIEELRQGPFRVEPRPPTQELDYVIQLPSLRTWHGPGLLWDRYRGPPLGLQHLFLDGGTEGAIENVLSHCAHLETLQVDMNTLVPFRLNLLGDTLRKLGQNLEKLWLGPQPGMRMGTMGSLRTVSRLKQLTIPLRMLFEPSDPFVDPLGLLGEPWEMQVREGKLLELVRSGRLSRLQSFRLTCDAKFILYRDSHIMFGKRLSRHLNTEGKWMHPHPLYAV